MFRNFSRSRLIHSEPDRKKSCGEPKYSIKIGMQFMGMSIQSAQGQFISPIQRAMATICKHPKVRIVSRHEDSEFVECVDCGEVFDSEEFRDMEIEESAETEPGLEVS